MSMMKEAAGGSGYITMFDADKTPPSGERFRQKLRVCNKVQSRTNNADSSSMEYCTFRFFYSFYFQQSMCCTKHRNSVSPQNITQAVWNASALRKCTKQYPSENLTQLKKIPAQYCDGFGLKECMCTRLGRDEDNRVF
jgi:hypothetical protein